MYGHLTITNIFYLGRSMRQQALRLDQEARWLLHETKIENWGMN